MQTRLNVSICNNKGPFGHLTVTDQDGRLAPAERSRSVTTRGSKTVFLLQIKTFVSGGNSGDGPFLRYGGDGSV